MASHAGADEIPAHQRDNSGNQEPPSANPNEMRGIYDVVDDMANNQDEIFKWFQRELKPIHLRDSIEPGPNACDIGFYRVPRENENKFGWLLYRTVEFQIKKPDKDFKKSEFNILKKRKTPPLFVVHEVVQSGQHLKIHVYELRTESIQTHFCKVMEGETTGLPQPISTKDLRIMIFASYDPIVDKFEQTSDYEGLVVKIGGYLQKPRTTVENGTAQRLVETLSAQLVKKNIEDSGTTKKNAPKDVDASSTVVQRERQSYPKNFRREYRLTKPLLRDFLLNTLMRPEHMSVVFQSDLALKTELQHRLKIMSGNGEPSTYNVIMRYICETRLEEIENGQVHVDLSTDCDNLLNESKLRKMKLLPSSILSYLKRCGLMTCTHALLECAERIDKIVELILSIKKSEIPVKITRPCSNADECMESLRFLLTNQASFQTTNIHIPDEDEYAIAFEHVVSFVFVGNPENIKFSIEKLPIALWISHFTSFGSQFTYSVNMLDTVLSESLLMKNEQFVRRFFDQSFGVEVDGDLELSELFAKRKLEDPEAVTGAGPKKRRRVSQNTQEEIPTDSAPGAAETGSGGTGLILTDKRKRRPTEKMRHMNNKRIRNALGFRNYSDEKEKKGSGSDSEEGSSESECDAD